MSHKQSCGQRFSAHENIQSHLRIERLELAAELPLNNQMIMPNTVTTNILPLNPAEYEYYR